MLKNKRLALIAALLYCIPPAPAVLSIPYNEPFFALFTYTALLTLQQEDLLRAAVYFALATAFRANGILNAGFLVWHKIWRPSSVCRSLLSEALLMLFATEAETRWTLDLHLRHLRDCNGSILGLSTLRLRPILCEYRY